MTDWPWGKRVRFENGQLEILPDDTPVDYWVCPRVDEPWTWTYKMRQGTAKCTKCRDLIMYRLGDHPPPITTPKICTRCAEKLS